MSSNSVDRITPTALVQRVCDELSPPDQRRFLLALALRAEELLTARGGQGQVEVRALQISVPPLHRSYTIPARLTVESLDALAAFKAGLANGSITFQHSFWSDLGGSRIRLLIGAVCLIGVDTVATFATDEWIVEFTVQAGRRDTAAFPKI